MVALETEGATKFPECGEEREPPIIVPRVELSPDFGQGVNQLYMRVVFVHSPHQSCDVLAPRIERGSLLGCVVVALIDAHDPVTRT